MELELRPMSEEQITSVIRLEQECHLSSRGEDGYLNLLQDERWLLLVAQQSLSITGIFSGQMVLDELQIDNIAVADDWRQKGIATRLLTNALEIAAEKGMVTAILEVRESNIPARRLYERHGFIVSGRRKRYYSNPLDDALLMSLNLDKHT
ncbi:MAG: ribosomal protein S18-alanine N-acetyltransferase [Acidobacteriota bacterium]